MSRHDKTVVQGDTSCSTRQSRLKGRETKGDHQDAVQSEVLRGLPCCGDQNEWKGLNSGNI